MVPSFVRHAFCLDDAFVFLHLPLCAVYPLYLKPSFLFLVFFCWTCVPNVRYPISCSLCFTPSRFLPFASGEYAYCVPFPFILL